MPDPGQVWPDRSLLGRSGRVVAGMPVLASSPLRGGRHAGSPVEPGSPWVGRAPVTGLVADALAGGLVTAGGTWDR